MSQSLTETPSLTQEDPCKSSVLAGRKIRQQIQKRGDYEGEMSGNEEDGSEESEWKSDKERLDTHTCC